MPPILKSILKLIAVIVVIVIGFKVNWLVGLAAILVILGYFVYVNRSAYVRSEGQSGLYEG